MRSSKSLRRAEVFLRVGVFGLSHMFLVLLQGDARRSTL